MIRFFDSFSAIKPAVPESNGCRVDTDRSLRELIAQTPMRIWRPGDPVSARGTRILIGVAPWNGYDMRLLDIINEWLSQHSGTLLFEVFNADSILDQQQFRDFVPEIREVFHTPVVGVWLEGRLVECGEGFIGREIVARLVGSSSQDITHFVTQWREQRAAASA
jgi:hypothetical protein